MERYNSPVCDRIESQWYVNPPYDVHRQVLSLDDLDLEVVVRGQAWHIVPGLAVLVAAVYAAVEGQVHFPDTATVLKLLSFFAILRCLVTVPLRVMQERDDLVYLDQFCVKHMPLASYILGTLTVPVIATGMLALTAMLSSTVAAILLCMLLLGQTVNSSLLAVRCLGVPAHPAVLYILTVMSITAAAYVF